MKKLFTLNNLSSGFFYFSILIFLIGFNFTDAPPPSGWYQQFMPFLNNRPISDITFLDSLTGWAVTPYVAVNDTTYVLKTTNGGDNWFIQFIGTGQFVGRNRIYFLNINTGFTCGADHFTGSTRITKTTDGGDNWFSLNNPPTTSVFDDMAVLNEDTIWLAASSSLGTGIWRTTNGGLNWTPQLSAGAYNPDRVYMYNGRFGFADANGGIALYRTTNGGLNWDIIPGIDGFRDIHFVDTIVGWKSYGTMEKTTNGGLNWVNQTLPGGGDIQTTSMYEFENINKDTIWGVGGQILQGNIKGMVYRTTNGGINWLFQVPIISPNIPQYIYVNFVNKTNGWAYPNINRGIHTITGGNDTFYTSTKQIISFVPTNPYIEQNYPNPFNPKTIIQYKISMLCNIQLRIYNLQGREIAVLVNSKQSTGTYSISFDGTKYSSGVYFYSLIIDGKLIDTKKMVLLK